MSLSAFVFVVFSTLSDFFNFLNIDPSRSQYLQWIEANHGSRSTVHKKRVGRKHDSFLPFISSALARLSQTGTPILSLYICFPERSSLIIRIHRDYTIYSLYVLIDYQLDLYIALYSFY